jgi:hypothetical protein
MAVVPYPPDLSLENQLLWTRSLMLFPDSPDNAVTFFARKFVGAEFKNIKPGEDVSIMIEWVRALAFGAGVNELIDLEKQRVRAGTTAGLILALVYVMAAGQYKKPSINKAVHIIEESSIRMRKEQVQFSHFTGRKEIYEAWKLMRSSAHFWSRLCENTSSCARKIPIAR